MTRDEILAMNPGETLNNVLMSYMGYSGPFSTYIPATLQVITKITHTIRIQGEKPTVVISCYPDGSYRVAIGRMTQDPDGIYGHGKTFPEAVCKAYLLAVMEVE